MQKLLGDVIIMEGAENEATTSRKYSQIQPVYKVGCRGCDTHEFTPQLCCTCKQEAKAVDIQYLKELIKDFKEQLFPTFSGELESDVVMKSVTKRAREEQQEEVKYKNARNDLPK